MGLKRMHKCFGHFQISRNKGKPHKQTDYVSGFIHMLSAKIHNHWGIILLVIGWEERLRPRTGELGDLHVVLDSAQDFFYYQGKSLFPLSQFPHP